MPKQSLVLQIFVASPSDVSEERSILDQVVAEQNKILSKSTGITFEIVKWETDVAPGFGKEPQDVINRQITDDYDVFIGIFWLRAGTPTRSSASGSIEEFHRALERFKRDGSPEVMVYFKNTAINPDKIDLDQYRTLKEFKESISADGGLYSTFDDQPGFESSLRTHLALVAHRAAQIHSQSIAPSVSSQELTTSSPIENDEELGYLDYIDLHEESMKQMNSCMSTITELMGNQSRRTAERTERLGNSMDDPQRARKFISLQAGDMDQFAKDLEPVIARHAHHREIAFDALSKAITFQREFGGEEADLTSLRENLLTLKKSIISAKDSTIEMRDTTQSIPRLTKELNHAKRAQVQAIDGLIDEIEKTSNNVDNVIDSIDRLA